MRIIDIEDAKKLFGRVVEPGEYTIQTGYEFYLMNDPLRTYSKIQHEPYLIKVVDNSEYDHGNADQMSNWNKAELLYLAWLITALVVVILGKGCHAQIIFNPGLEAGLILGGYMKEEAMKVHADAVLAADGVLYDAGFADGEISGKAAGGGFVQADIDKAVVDAKAAEDAILQPKIDELVAKVAALQADDNAKTELLEKIKGLFAPTSSPAAQVDGPFGGLFYEKEKEIPASILKQNRRFQKGSDSCAELLAVR